MNYFDTDISNSTNTVVHFDKKKRWQFIFTFADKVAHNICGAGWFVHTIIHQHVL